MWVKWNLRRFLSWFCAQNVVTERNKCQLWVASGYKPPVYSWQYEKNFRKCKFTQSNAGFSCPVLSGIEKRSLNIEHYTNKYKQRPAATTETKQRSKRRLIFSFVIGSEKPRLASRSTHWIEYSRSSHLQMLTSRCPHHYLHPTARDAQPRTQTCTLLSTPGKITFKDSRYPQQLLRQKHWQGRAKLPNNGECRVHSHPFTL